MIRAAIVGATGYTGITLFKLLSRHPKILVDCVVSQSRQGKQLSSVLPNHLMPSLDLVLEGFSVARLADFDVVFFATPHGVSMNFVPDLLKKGVVVIDLSADFRIHDAALWEKWYQQPHQAAHLLNSSIYGLSEIYREQIANANLIACPGCYPTAVSLGLAPLLKKYTVRSVVADCKSGASGAGRQPDANFNFCDMDQNFYAYGIQGHRHIPEMTQQLESWHKDAFDFHFVPHIVPMRYGIYATMYVRLSGMVQIDELLEYYQAFYQDSVFVNILSHKQFPRMLAVSGTNGVCIGLCAQGDLLVIGVAIDNLMKGAAGQAVQNMNIRFGLKEDQGLLKAGE